MPADYIHNLPTTEYIYLARNVFTSILFIVTVNRNPAIRSVGQNPKKKTP